MICVKSSGMAAQKVVSAPPTWVRVGVRVRVRVGVRVEVRVRVGLGREGATTERPTPN